MIQTNAAQATPDHIIAVWGQRTLVATAGTTLVEAAPWDTIWGNGLAENDLRSQQRSTWLGTNWLGELLTEVRDTMMAGLL